MATDTDAAPLRLKKTFKSATASVPVDAATANPTCYLLDKIPAEMRNTIYELVFTVDHNEDGTVDICRIAPPSEALTMTCRQIYQESRGLYKSAYQDFWQESNFIINPGENLLNDIEALREDDLQHIRHIMACYQVQQEEVTDTHRMLNNNGVWKFTSTVEGNTLKDNSYLISHESAGEEWAGLYTETRAIEESARRQLAPSMKRQLTLHANWVNEVWE